TIYKADIAEEDITAPKLVTGTLEYTGDPQGLVDADNPGSVANDAGTLEYSTDGENFSARRPTGTNADDYEVWYRVKGDSNHNDMAAVKVAGKVTIDPQEVDAPTIGFTPTGATYDSKEHKPAVTVKDKNGRTIPESEYTVIYEPDTDWIKAGSHTVTVTDKPGKTGGNYVITQKQETFTILPMGQTTFTITNQPGEVRYGDSFTLSTTGGSGTGEVTWAISGNDAKGSPIAEIKTNGLVTIKSTGGPVVVTAQKDGGGNYGTVTATWTFSVEKRPAEAIVTAKNKVFNNNDAADLEITWKSGDVLSGDRTSLTNDLMDALSGKFSSADAENNKTDTISGDVSGIAKYDITFNTPTTA
ncbi:MAG: hypothetical protein K2K53_07120, partial [Oscillospiraceae bacterium]|nr:hypothetical protein [Oscillospiraceae bacterium]